MTLSAVVQGEPGLGQRPGNVAGERRQGIIDGKRTTIGIRKPGHSIGELSSLGEHPDRPEVGRLQAEIVLLCI